MAGKQPSCNLRGRCHLMPRAPVDILAPLLRLLGFEQPSAQPDAITLAIQSAVMARQVAQLDAWLKANFPAKLFSSWSRIQKAMVDAAARPPGRRDGTAR